MLVCLLCAGCNFGGYDAQETLRLAVNDASTSLNFLYTILEPNITIIMNLQEGLVQYDEGGQLIPMSAESWHVSTDQKMYTFTIREDAKWANGAPLTAADFVYSIHRRIEDEKAVYKEYYKDLANGEAVLAGTLPLESLGVRALGEKELVFTLEQPKAAFLNLLAFETFLPLNQQFYEAVGADSYGTSAETILANGAYTLKDYHGTDGWVFAKNLTYWNAAHTSLAHIDVHVVKESATSELLWRNDELDILDVSSDLMDKYQTDARLQHAQKSQMNYFYLSSAIGNNPLLANKNFRAAIAHSIDKRVIVDSILKDASRPADYFVAKNILFHGKDEFRDVAGTFTSPMFDLIQAQTYLNAAKQELNQTDLAFDLEIYDLGRTKSIYDNVKAQIEQNLPGVHVNLILNPTQTYFQKLYEYQTPAAASQWEPDYLDVANYFLPFHSAASQNFARWTNEAYDELYAVGEAPKLATDGNGRMQTFAEAELRLIDDYTIIPLYQSGISYLQKENVRGYYFSPGLPHILYKYVWKED